MMAQPGNKESGSADALLGALEEVAQARTAGDAMRQAHALAELGEIHLQCDRPGDALAHLQESAGLFQQLGAQSGDRHVSGLIGLALAALDQPSQADSFLEVGRAYAQEKGERDAEALFSHTLAVISLQLHQIEKAARYAEQSLRLYTLLEDALYGQASALQVTGMILRVQGRVSEAIDCYRQSLSLLEGQEEVQSRQVRAATQQYLAESFHQVGQPTESARCSARAYQLFTALGEQDAAYFVLHDRARFDLECGQVTRAARFAKQACDLARATGDMNKIVSALTLLAETQKKQGHPKLAIALWQEGAEQAELLGDKRRAAALYDTIGQAREGMNHTRWASRAHLAALRLYNDLDDLQSATRQLAIIASLEARQGYLDTCLQHYRTTRQGYRMLGDPYTEAASFIEQGMALRRFWYCFEAPGLGSLRYGIDLLSRMLADGGQEEFEGLVQRARQLLEGLDHEFGEADFHRLLQQSEVEYAEAANEAEAERQKRESESRPLDTEIDRLGLMRHAWGRKEESARGAVMLVEHYGYCEAAISAYEQAITRLRAGHNRLGEAVLTGTIAVIHQALHPGSGWGNWIQLAALYRDAGDRIGMGRTLYNEGVRSLQIAQPNLEGARCYLQAAYGYLGQAQAGESETERARALLADVEERRSGGSLSPRGKRRPASSLWIQEQLRALGSVKIIRGPARGEEVGSGVQREPVAEAGNLLEATTLILAFLLEEGLQEHPRQFEFTAHDGYSTGVSGVSFGVSLLCEGQRAADFDEGHYLVQFLELGFGDTHDMESFGFQPITRPTREGFKPGFWPTTRKGLEQSLLTYLDREYRTSLGSRAAHVLNAERIPVCRISWGYGVGFLLEAPEWVPGERR